MKNAKEKYERIKKNLLEKEFEELYKKKLEVIRKRDLLFNKIIKEIATDEEQDKYEKLTIELNKLIDKIDQNVIQRKKNPFFLFLLIQKSL